MIKHLVDAISIVENSVQSLAKDFLFHLPQIVAGFILLLVTWLVSKITYQVLDRLLRRVNLRRSLRELFLKIVNVLVWLVGVLVVAVVVFPSFTPAKVLTTLGLGSVAIGFAFKDVFENFLAGVIILLREPFEIGDFIECQDYEGKVEDITVRDTYIRQVDGQRVVIPNAMLFKNPVTVRTNLSRRRVTIICGVAYDEDVDKARSIILEAVEQLQSVQDNQGVQVFAREFNSSSIDFEITWWTGSQPIDVRTSRDEVIAAVKKALDDAGIEIPFPYRTLTFKESLQVSKSSATEGARVK
jgi:small-conductance mechanosensitive channel